jgi:uncharacterized protein
MNFESFLQILKILLFICIGFAILLLFADCIVRSALYANPGTEIPSTPPQQMEQIRIKYDKDKYITSWYFIPRDFSDNIPILLYCHGNAENLQTLDNAGLYARLKSFEFPFLVIDFPGYGTSDGRSNEENIVKAGISSIKWLRNEYTSNPIIVIGWSLGAAVAVQIAAKSNECEGLISISCWSSFKDVAYSLYPDFLVAILVKNRFHSLKAASDISVPSLFIHGKKDSLIPFEQCVKVSKQVKGETTFVEVTNGGHNNILNKEKVWDSIDKYLQDYFLETDNQSSNLP